MIEPKYVNPSRRDLLKQLAVLGIVGITAPISSSLLSSCKSEKIIVNGIWKTDEGYETLRKSMSSIANVPNRYPDVIVEPKSETELLQCVAFANENDLQIITRCSGHNTAGSALRNGGMLINLAHLNSIEIDATNRTAKVQPGVKFRDFLATLQEHDLGFPFGDCGSVTFGGYLLGGGRGKNGNHYTQGPACYALLEAEVILADGSQVTVNKDQYSDIFWAIKGCGPGFFGITTRYTVQLFDPMQAIVLHQYYYPESYLPELINFFDQRIDQKDERIDIYIGLEDSKKTDELLCYIKLTAFMSSSDSPVEDAQKLLEYYKKEGVDEQSVAFEQTVNTSETFAEMLLEYPPGLRNNVETVFTDNSKAFLEVVDLFKNKPCDVIAEITHNSQMHLNKLKQDACYSAMGRHYINYYVIWFDEALDKEVQEWMDKMEAILQPHTVSHYVNMTDNAHYPHHIEECFSSQNWKRLGELRNKYDPTHRFYSYLGLS